jgi:hypothetical protein
MSYGNVLKRGMIFSESLAPKFAIKKCIRTFTIRLAENYNLIFLGFLRPKNIKI